MERVADEPECHPPKPGLGYASRPALAFTATRRSAVGIAFLVVAACLIKAASYFNTESASSRLSIAAAGSAAYAVLLLYGSFRIRR